MSQFDDLFKPSAVCGVKDVAAQKFITCFAKHMKRQGKFELPKWGDQVKTGVAKELAPYNPDWLYVRAASVARYVYIRGGCGVGSFRKVYGSQQRRGVCTEHYRKGSGKIVRYCMQQLEEMGIMEIDEKTGGRRITPEGQREMDTVAFQTISEEDEDDDDE
jgi:small subunit ribosomal protein S19e